MFKFKIKKNNGYTLLFAVLVSSLVLSIGISILTISKKEFLLATSARDSSSAFYASDGGMECAIYADTKNNAFSTSSNRTAFLGCNIVTSSFSVTTLPLNNFKKFVFHIKLGDSGGSCAQIVVEKKWNFNDNVPFTTIQSKGYNLGWNESTSLCDVPSAKRVERALFISY